MTVTEVYELFKSTDDPQVRALCLAFRELAIEMENVEHGFNMGTSWLGPEGRGVLDLLNDAHFKGELEELLG